MIKDQTWLKLNKKSVLYSIFLIFGMLLHKNKEDKSDLRIYTLQELQTKQQQGIVDFLTRCFTFSTLAVRLEICSGEF
jgi:hypothetical protein